MAKLGGKLLIKYRDPVAASFSSKDIVLNVQTGTLFYKRNRKLFALRGTPDNFDLVVFPGQSTNQQILINDSSQEDGSPIMEGTDQFRFKLASATCGCANYFHIGAETLTHFSGSVRIGEHLPGTCNILDDEVNPALKVYGNVSVVASPSGSMNGHITASGNIWSQDNVIASNDLYGTNAYIHDSLLHRGNTDTKLTFGIDTINLYSDGSNIATVSSASFTINGSNDLFIPGTDSAPSSGTSVLVLDNTTGQVYKTGSYGLTVGTFKGTGVRTGNGLIDGNLTVTGNISASGKLYGGLISSSQPNVVFYNNTTGELTYATSESLTTGGTESLWYDGQPNYISSSDNVLIDKNLGIGPWDGAYNNLEHNLHISGNDSSTDIGFKGTSGTDTSIGISQSNLVTFNILDHSDSSDTYPLKIIIGSDVNPNQPKAPNAILIQSQSSILPTYGGSVGYDIPNVAIGLVGTGSLGKFHVITDAHDGDGAILNDSGLLYNGIIVGPEYNPTADADMKTGSGVFINMQTAREPRILGKTEPGSGWGNNTTLLIHGEQDRSNTYPGSFAGGAAARAPFIEFRATDNTKQAYSASISNTLGNRLAAGGREDTGSIDEMFGNGQQWINGLDPSAQNSSLLYQFYNDKMPLLSIEAQGRVGIGNFGLNINPKALLHLKAKSSSNADILLQTGNETGSGLPGIKLGVGYNISNPGSGYGLFSSVNPFGILRLFTRKNFHNSASNKLYFNQAPDAVYLEAQGVEEGLQNQPYPFNIKGAAKNESEGNNIQLVIGGDGRPFSTSSISTSTLTGNNGTAALTIEGVSDFRRQGEIGIGIITPSSSLHVTRSVQANNFRTTNPVDILIDDSNHSIEMVSASNQVVGTNTTFTADFKVGDAIKIEGRDTIMSLTGGYTASNGSQTASISSSAGTPGNELIVGDTIQISSSFHTIEGFQSVGGNELILFTPAYNLATTQSLNLIHRTNPNFYQIATVTGIHNNTSMSIEDNWEGNSWTGSLGYKEDILFQVKTADYNPRFTVNAHGDITASGTASFGFLDIDSSNLPTFKSTGQRNGDSAITGSLTVTGTIKAQEFHTEFITSSVIFESGSTQFGDTADDTHTFVGNITASGNIAVGTGPGSVAISASGYVFAGLKQSSNTSLVFYNTSSGELTHATTSSLLGGLLSSSTQIATEISGAINSATSSILTNYGLLSSSAQISTNISGAINSATSSILTNYGLLSGSAQIATNISGAINSATSSLSASLAIDIASNSTNTFKSTGQRSGNSGITGSLHLTGSTSDLRVDGTVGIGTAAPTANNVMLHIKSNHTGLPTAIIEGDNGNSNANLEFKNTDISWVTGLTGGGYSDSFLIRSSSTNALYPFAIDPSAGGIATAPLLFMRDDKISILRGITPSANLHVSGNIVADGPNGSISASGLLFASSSEGNFSDIVVQDLTTGRFYTTSSAALSTTLPSGILSSSEQIATDISGAIDAATGSLLSSYTFLSSSTQIAADISGSWQGQNFISSSGEIAADISGSWQGQNFISASQTFLSTGQRSGDSAITGSLTVTGTITAQEFHTEFVSASIIYESGSTQFGDTADDIHTFTGDISASGNISASTAVFVNLPAASQLNTVYYDRFTGELTYAQAPSALNISGAIDTATGSVLNDYGLLSSSNQIAADISGSWQGQNFISASQTFLSTGQRNGDSAITGSFEVTSDITSSKLLIQKSTGQGTPTPGSSDVAIFQNNDNSEFASIAIIAADDRASQLHFGRHDDIDIGSIKYFHDEHSAADQFKFKVNGSNVVTFNNISGRGRIGVGSDFTPTDYFHAQGTLSGGGLTISSSNGGTILLKSANTRATLERIANDENLRLEFKTAGTTNWTLGNIAESDDNFYIYNGDGTGDKHISLTPTSTNFLTSISASGNITASGNISASGLLYTSSSLGLQNIATYNSESGQYFYTSSAGLSAQLDTFKQTGVRTGDSILSGSLIIRSTGATNPGDANLTIVGGGASADDATLSLRQNLDTAGYAVKYDGGLDHFQILGNNEQDIHLSIQHGDGRVRIPGIISSSGKVYHGGLTYGTAGSLVTMDPTTGEFKRQATAGVLANAIPGLLSSSQQIATDISGAIDAATGSLLNSYTFLSSSTQIAADISGSWQGQNFISASQTFLSTGQRNGDSAITGSLILTNLTASGHISSSGNIIGLQIFSDGRVFSNDRVGVYNTDTINFVANGTHPTEIDGTNIKLDAPVTASGNISASGNIVAQDFATPGKIYLNSNIVNTGTDYIEYADGGFFYKGSGKFHENITASGTISASGGYIIGNNISASATLSGLTITGKRATLTNYISASQLISSGHITASGNISASGLLFASSSQGNYSDIVVQDLTTGRFYTTASSAIATTDTFKLTGQRNGDSAITGSLTVTGTITAQEFHTEFISSSIIFESGSTQFGNSADDIHIFSGSINVKDEGHITASGNISASGGTITANNINLDGEAIIAGNTAVSGKLFAGLTAGTENNLVYYDTVSGELKEDTIASLTNTAVFAQAVSGAFAGTSSSLSASIATNTTNIATNVTNIQDVSSGVSNNTALINDNTTLINALPTAASVSGSFLLNTTDTLTGNLTVTDGITSSKIVSTTNLILNSDVDNNSAGALDNIIFQTHGSERMRISGSGRVGIGTALPDKKLVIAKGVTGDAAISASGELYISASVGSYSDILVYSGINNGGRIYQTPITSLDTFKNTGQRNGDSAITGALEVTGNISASDGIYLPQMTPIIFDSPDTFIRANSGGNESLQIFADVDIQLKPDNDLELYENNDLWTIFKGAERELVVEGSIHADGSGGHITASGNISASGTIHAAGGTMSDNITFDSTKGINFVDSGTQIIGNATNMTIEGDDSVNILGDTSVVVTSPLFYATGNISASGHISASHAIFPNLPSNVTSNVLYFNNGTGELSYGQAANQFNAAGISGSWQGQNFLQNVVEDTTPQLGGNLDAQDNDIEDAGTITLTGANTPANIPDPGTDDKIILSVVDNSSSDNTLGISTNTGAVSIGAQNNSYIHFKTRDVDQGYYFETVASANAADVKLALEGVRLTGGATNSSLHTGDVVFCSQAAKDVVLRRKHDGDNELKIGDDTLTVTLDGTSRFAIDGAGAITITGPSNATSDTDKFLVSDSGVIKYRTGAEVLSDIGALSTLSTSYIADVTGGEGITINDTSLLSGGTNAEVNFDPGGSAGELITSGDTSGGSDLYESHSTLIYDGTDLQVHGGDIIAFYSSDKRLKDNVTPISNPIKKILQIGGYTFDWNEKQDTYKGHDIGVIAQEVEKVLPEVVETRENGYKAVKYQKMVPLLIEAIKDQQKQIDELKKLIENASK